MSSFPSILCAMYRSDAISLLRFSVEIASDIFVSSMKMLHLFLFILPPTCSFKTGMTSMAPLKSGTSDLMIIKFTTVSLSLSSTGCFDRIIFFPMSQFPLTCTIFW